MKQGMREAKMGRLGPSAASIERPLLRAANARGPGACGAGRGRPAGVGRAAFVQGLHGRDGAPSRLAPQATAGGRTLSTPRCWAFPPAIARREGPAAQRG